MNKLKAVQYLVDYRLWLKTSLFKNWENAVEKEKIYYSIAKSYQDVMDNHHNHAIQRLEEAIILLKHMRNK